MLSLTVTTPQARGTFIPYTQVCLLFVSRQMCYSVRVSEVFALLLITDVCFLEYVAVVTVASVGCEWFCEPDGKAI